MRTQKPHIHTSTTTKKIKINFTVFNGKKKNYTSIFLKMLFCKTILSSASASVLNWTPKNESDRKFSNYIKVITIWNDI